jgi:hypothetical protein
MEKIDFKKTMKPLFQASDKKVSFIEVPVLKYLMVKGKGSPEHIDFMHAIEALYGAAYTLKFMLKDQKPAGYYDFVIPPLEALWCMDCGTFDVSKPEEWLWTAMIMQPDYITESLLKDAVTALKKKKTVHSADKLDLTVLKEGKAIQMMHIGPYNEVGKTYTILEQELKADKKIITGAGHEIYLSDPRKVAPEKLKTIVRMPYK